MSWDSERSSKMEGLEGEVSGEEESGWMYSIGIVI